MATKDTKQDKPDTEEAPVYGGEIQEPVTAPIGKIDDEALRSLTSFEDALALAEQTYGDVIDISKELGTGFAILTDKSRLVGQKLLLLKWGFANGDHGKSFVSCAVVTERGEKFIVNDGGTGICEQLKDYSIRKDRHGGLVANNGLRASTYPTCKGCGVPRPSSVEICDTPGCGDPMSDRGTGTTYYLDLSA